MQEVRESDKSLKHDLESNALWKRSSLLPVSYSPCSKSRGYQKVLTGFYNCGLWENIFGGIKK